VLQQSFIVMLAEAGCIASRGVRGRKSKPAVHDPGPRFPKSEIFIGKKLLLFNNGHARPGVQREKQADPDQSRTYRARCDNRSVFRLAMACCRNERYFRPKPSAAILFDEKNNIVFNKLDKLSIVAVP